MKVSKMTLAQVKSLLTEFSDSVTEELRHAISEDERAGVRKLYRQYCRQKELEIREKIRLKRMQFYEEGARRKGYSVIAGVDEAGRGPLAGPVIAAAVVLPPDAQIMYINDSKKLTPLKREQLYAEITEKALGWGIGSSSVEEIDSLNILQASLLAMRRAVQSLLSRPEFILVDAVSIPDLDIPQLSIVKGDGLSVSIAAASIIAKVTRDRIMNVLDNQLPQYGFGRHKGYGTGDHIRALKEHGPCPQHRKTFIRSLEL